MATYPSFQSVLPKRGDVGPVDEPPQDPLSALATMFGVSRDTAASGALDSGASGYRVPGIGAIDPGKETRQLADGSTVSDWGNPNTAYGRGEQDQASAEEQAQRDRAAKMQSLSDFFLPDAERQRKEQSDLALAPERLKAESAANVARIQNEGKIIPAQIRADGAANPFMGSSDGGGSDPVAYWATQAFRDPSVLTKIPANLKSAVVMHMAQSGGDVNTLTNQTKQMSETANDLLPLIDRVTSQADMLKRQGLFDLVHSPIRQFLVQHGAGSLLGYGPTVASQVGEFQTKLGLLQSGVARAHAGARGAGNSEIAARFEKLMNAGGDVPTFLGELQGVKELLSIYGAHTAPSGGSPAGDPWAMPPTADELAGGR